MFTFLDKEIERSKIEIYALDTNTSSYSSGFYPNSETSRQFRCWHQLNQYVGIFFSNLFSSNIIHNSNKQQTTNNKQ
jgi:hypothetical protein